MKLFAFYTKKRSEKSGHSTNKISPVYFWNFYIFYFTILNLGKVTQAISLQRILLQEVLALSQKVELDDSSAETDKSVEHTLKAAVITSSSSTKLKSTLPSDSSDKVSNNSTSNSKILLPVNITQLLQSPNNLELYATIKLLQEVDLDQEDCLQLLLLYKNGHIQDKELVPMIWLALLEAIKTVKQDRIEEKRQFDNSYQRSQILEESDYESDMGYQSDSDSDHSLERETTGAIVLDKDNQNSQLFEFQQRRGFPGSVSNVISNSDEGYGSGGGYDTTSSYPSDMESMYEYATTTAFEILSSEYSYEDIENLQISDINTDFAKSFQLRNVGSVLDAFSVPKIQIPKTQIANAGISKTETLEATPTVQSSSQKSSRVYTKPYRYSVQENTDFKQPIPSSETITSSSFSQSRTSTPSRGEKSTLRTLADFVLKGLRAYKNIFRKIY